MHNQMESRTHQQRCLPEPLHDNVRANAFLDITPDLLQQLSGKQYHARCSISNLGVLGTRDIHQSSGSGVYDIEELEDSGAIVGDLGFAAVVYNKFVHTPWAKSAGEGLRDGETCGDVRQQLSLSLRGVRPLFQENDGRLLVRVSRRFVIPTCSRSPSADHAA